MNIQFSIAEWAAWAPGLADKAAWRAKFADAKGAWDSSDVAAPVAELAPMTRRRLNRIGRSALQVAYAAHARCLASSPGGETCMDVSPASETWTPCPVIFASRYGDLERSVVLLRALANHESLSPTAFSVSVHNAIGAIFSIERVDTENYSALAAGVDTVPCALVEANALLADGAEAVLLVVYEDPLPDVYAVFADAPQIPRAWACKIVPPNPATEVIALTKHTDFTAPSEVLCPLPLDLAVLSFLIGAAPSLEAHASSKR